MIIVDANNWVRRCLETGSSARSLFNEFMVDGDQKILVWDGPHALKARREIFPDYKARRVKATTDMYLNLDLVREVLAFTRAVQVRVPGHEADDVIAELVKGNEANCQIVSNDKDFLALGVPCGANPIPGVEPRHIRLYKTFVGDPSDNIPGCPGFGQKAWDEGDPDALHAWLHDGADYEFPKRAKPDREQLLQFWQVVGFLPVTIGPEHVTVGREDLAGGEALLQRWMQ